MAIGSTAMAIIGMGSALASGAMGAISASQQADAQKAQAEYQADMANYNAKVAEGNAKMAEQEGKDAKKAAYEQSLENRQQAAQIVGSQRAKQAASGVQVDTGSALDLNLDTVEKGELDAFNIAQAGEAQAYNKNVEAWNYRNQASGLESQADMYTKRARQAPFSASTKSLSGSLLSGLQKMGNGFGKLKY